MSESRFVYVTYIRTTPEALWDALIKPEFTKKYWFGMTQDCAWTVGASWALTFPDGRVADSGEVLEIDPPKHLVLKWRHALNPDLHEEGFTRASFEIERREEIVKLTVVHEIGVANSKTIAAVSTGWPAVLSGLKSLLETGEALDPALVLPGRK